MYFKPQIIKTSCRGAKEPGIPNQDFLLVAQWAEYLAVAIADGLGSSPHSLAGAKLACRIVVNVLKREGWNLIVADFGKRILEEWNMEISKMSGNVSDYRTTSSFVFVDMKRRKIISGQLGDGLIAVRADGKFQSFNASEKDFINETECLGSSKDSSYLIRVCEYQEDYNFLIATDGIGDELVLDKMDLLFEYLKRKYKRIQSSKRNSLLRSEILKTMSNKNNDDKTMIFAWSKKANR